MAIEAKRGCGYRKVGGLYLVDDGAGMPCCKMPIELTVCPCCGGGIKQARGWTWVDAIKLFGDRQCRADGLQRAACPASNPAVIGKAGLIWIGESFYPRPVDFLNEAATQGISRRLPAIPRGYKPGETWVLFAHPKAIQKPRTVGKRADYEYGFCVINPVTGEPQDEQNFAAPAHAEEYAARLDLQDPVFVPGIIRICRPRGFERIVTHSDVSNYVRAQEKAEDDRTMDETVAFNLAKSDEARGVKWIPVPDDDPDHRGSVHDNKRKGVEAEETSE